ncbi:TIGR02757 family protein [bacterium]|nr:TIGR02757 family protein [bacterium]
MVDAHKEADWQVLGDLLNEKYLQFHTSAFIDDDPISVPHRFSKLQDIEIAAFFAAIFAWGQRKTIINKSMELMQRMDMSPHDFVLNSTEADLKSLDSFKHRTFQNTDLRYFLLRLQKHYQHHASLELMFSQGSSFRDRLVRFEQQFTNLPQFESRTAKHLATPARNSTCKRLCMFLRWMVRRDQLGVDFGLWNSIQTAELCMPLDVHVEKVGRALGLINRKQRDWQTVEELTNNLRKFDPLDPVKYDYALFGMGVLDSPL